MKPNYPVAIKGGVGQQATESRTRIHLNGTKRMLKASGLMLEGIRKIVDLGCRNGDTTLGVLQEAPKDAKVIGIEEYREALLLAKAKFGVSSEKEAMHIADLISEMPEGWIETFRNESEEFKDRTSFFTSQVENMPELIQNADLIFGFQILHWLNANEDGFPTTETLAAINQSLAPGGKFLAGTSTAFVELSPEEKVEGKKKSEYDFNAHPFVKMFFARVGEIIEKLTGKTPIPIVNKPQLSMDKLTNLLESVGFRDVQHGGFLATNGREELLFRVLPLTAVHQGRLGGIAPEQRELVTQLALNYTNADCELIVMEGKPDPRLVETNVYDVVPFILATKAN